LNVTVYDRFAQPRALHRTASALSRACRTVSFRGVGGQRKNKANNLGWTAPVAADEMIAALHGQGSFDAKEKEWVAAQDSLYLQ